MRNGRAIARVWWLLPVLALLGCARDEPRAVDPKRSPPSAAKLDTAAEPASAVEPGAVDEARLAAAQAQRLAAARRYLDQAQAAADERHRQAVLACAAPQQVDPEGCAAAADEAVEVERQAARAEFETQMRQPD